MSRLPSHIVQKRFSSINEDVASDALHFILGSSDAARAGMMKLLRGFQPHLPKLHFRTQDSQHGCRPSIWGLYTIWGGKPHQRAAAIHREQILGETNGRPPIAYRGQPHSYRKTLNDLPDEMWTKIKIEFYGEPADAVFKALED